MVRLNYVAALLLAAMWVIAIINILVDANFVSTAAVLLISAYLLISLFQSRLLTVFLTLTLILSALALSIYYGRIDALWLGLERSVLFAAFLPTLSLLRTTARGDARLENYRRRLDHVSSEARPVWIVSGAFGLASVLSVGSSAVFSSLIADNAPEKQRVAQARANICGASLAVIWSPFFVALAVVSDFLPDVPLLALMGSGVLISSVALITATKVYARDEPFWTLLQAVSALSGFALPIGAVTALVVAIRAVSPLSTIETMLLVLPVLCLGYLAVRGMMRVWTARRDVWAAMTVMHDDVATVAAAMIFGTLLGATPLLESLVPVAALAVLPNFVIVAVCIATMALLGFLAVQPLVAGTLSLIAFTSIGADISELAIGLSVLMGWSASSMLSISSLQVRVAAAQYNVRPEQLVIGRNLVFFFICLPLVVGVIITLDKFA
jgi:hypothetical protein